MSKYNAYTDLEIDRQVADRLGYRAIIANSFWPEVTDKVTKVIAPSGVAMVEGEIGCDIWERFFSMVYGWTQLNARASQLLRLIRDDELRCGVEDGTAREICIAYLEDYG